MLLWTSTDFYRIRMTVDQIDLQFPFYKGSRLQKNSPKKLRNCQGSQLKPEDTQNFHESRPTASWLHSTKKKRHTKKKGLGNDRTRFLWVTITAFARNNQWCTIQSLQQHKFASILFIVDFLAPEWYLE